MPVLGTFIGPPAAQKAFLDKLVDEQILNLRRLGSLASQDAWTLLKHSLQQKLRHLMRTLDHPSLADSWRRADAALLAVVDELRHPEGRSFKKDARAERLATLPGRHGGLGIISHAECAPIAADVASKQSRATLADRYSTPGLSGDARPPKLSQHERCNLLWMREVDALVGTLEGAERACFVENMGSIARRWLGVIPTSQELMLTDHAIAAGLRVRTLWLPLAPCRACHHAPEASHIDTCPANPISRRTARHEEIKNAIHGALSSLQGTVTREPLQAFSTRRDDIEFLPCTADSMPVTYIDVTVTSINTATNRNVLDKCRVPAQGGLSVMQEAILEVLAREEDRKFGKRPANASIGVFIPIAFSAGGMPAKFTAVAIKKWARWLTPFAYAQLIKRMSVGLIRARGLSTHVRHALVVGDTGEGESEVALLQQAVISSSAITPESGEGQVEV